MKFDGSVTTCSWSCELWNLDLDHLTYKWLDQDHQWEDQSQQDRLQLSKLIEDRQWPMMSFGGGIASFLQSHASGEVYAAAMTSRASASYDPRSEIYQCILADPKGIWRFHNGGDTIWNSWCWTGFVTMDTSLQISCNEKKVKLLAPCRVVWWVYFIGRWVAALNSTKSLGHY